MKWSWQKGDFFSCSHSALSMMQSWFWGKTQDSYLFFHKASAGQTAGRLNMIPPTNLRWSSEGGDRSEWRWKWSNRLCCPCVVRSRSPLTIAASWSSCAHRFGCWFSAWWLWWQWPLSYLPHGGFPSGLRGAVGWSGVLQGLVPAVHFGLQVRQQLAIGRKDHGVVNYDQGLHCIVKITQLGEESWILGNEHPCNSMLK